MRLICTSKVKGIFMLILMLFLCLFLGYSFIMYSVDISNAIYKSINSCLTIIIPSLFGFLVLSSIIIKSNLYTFLSRPFDLISRYAFKIPTEYFSVFLISLFAGYPVGAKLINELIEQKEITNNEASTMLCYCYSSSPTFVLGLVGVQLFSSIEIGIYIYLSLIITNILVAIIIGLRKKVPQKIIKKEKLTFSTQIFISSVENGAKSIFVVCIMIVFFSIIVQILDNTGILAILSFVLFKITNIDLISSTALIKSVFEISNLSSLNKYCYNLIPIITGIFSFGGICIVLQIASLTKGKIKLAKFLIIRLMSSILAGIISYMMFLKMSAELSVSVIKYTSVGIRYISPIPSIFLLIMTILLLSKKNVAKL